MSVRGRVAAAIGAGLMLTLGGAAATAAPTAAPQPELRQLYGMLDDNTPSEICNLYQSPNNTRASICSAASFPSQEGVVDGYYRGTISGDTGYMEVRINSTVHKIWVKPDFRGIWTDAASVQFRACGYTGGCGPWK